MGKSVGDVFALLSQSNPFGDPKAHTARSFKMLHEANDVLVCGEFDPYTGECDGKVITFEQDKTLTFSNILRGRKSGRTLRIR